MMNAVDGGGAKAAAVIDDGGGVDGGVFCTVFVAFSWLFRCCFEGKVVHFLGAVLKAKWCSFGEKMALFLKAK